ncbi:MAG: thioredoxin family protein [Chitinophagaceae bacterium]|nr:MAG: thioredoxin family protein [Chitinophagaceae bacterium]
MTSLFLLFLSANIFAGTPYAVGDYAKDFNLKNVHGDYVSMKNIDAKGFIVIFSCNHCPFVVNSEERMIKLHNKYAPKGFPIIAINPNDEEIVPEDSYENMIIRAEERDFPFEYVYDETQEVAKAYGATHTPQVFLLVRENDKFKVVYTGAIDDSPRFPERVEEKFLEAALNNLLNGKKPDPNTTRAVGCSIKWSKN